MTFNEIAKHDITWGEMRVRPAVSSDSFFFRHVYFEGLVTLARISEADTYERKYELLHNFQASGYCYYDVAAALRASRRLKGRSLPVAFHGQTWIGRYRDGREYASLVQPPFFEDPDDGPFRSWNWAHEANATHFAYFAQPQALLRKWGYTMWDEERLDSLGMMKQWFLTSDLSSEEYSPARREVDELRHNSQGWDWYDSWVARAKIWINGGSGWWDFGDESRIIWKYGKPHDTEPASMLGLSLEES
ncbi:hypothetical protein SLS62_001261 [Diatrype stigma]|uniref:Uncharacterized protein n=1 Tax=Diatrype stigma TaxID=117547 RepID=A0AAN9YTU4_9PEZI